LPRLIAIDHVQLEMPAGGEASARSFFGDLLGLPEVAKPPVLRRHGGCWFADGPVAIHLGVEPAFQPALKAHPAFRVDDLDALAARLEAAGHPITWDDAIPGTRRFHARDPFGNRLEFIAAEPDSAA
jgi:catechol 2,3-dioxygenase-like lactoylglutathione lyase family enzyme